MSCITAYSWRPNPERMSLRIARQKVLSALRLSLSLLVPVAALYACQPLPQPETSQDRQPPSTWPEFDYARSAAAGRRVYRLEPDATQIDVVVRRDGPLARFGHDHVLSVGRPEGFLQLDDQRFAGRADLRFRIDQLTVDSPVARDRYGLDTNPDDDAIRATRKNLMDHVVDAERWPWATLVMEEFQQQGGHSSAVLSIGINGSSHTSRQPFRLNRAGDDIVVEGFFILHQTDLGIEPFSALGGGLRVADPMEIHFHIEAGPWQ